MVLMSGSRRARNQASIVNRPTCGGNKKAGILTYTNVGFLQSLSGASWRTSMTYPTNVCPNSYSLGGRNQLTSGGVGKTSNLASTGRGGFVMKSH